MILRETMAAVSKDPVGSKASPQEVPRIVVLTLDQSDAFKEHGQDITLQPAWQWLD